MAKESLFQQSVVVLPHFRWKRYLQTYFLKTWDLPCLSGIRFIVGQEDFGELEEVLCPSLQREKMPGLVELGVRLHAELERLFTGWATCTEGEHLLYQPLFTYLDIDPQKETKKAHRHLFAFSQALARHYREGVLYGKQEKESKAVSWQRGLWEKVAFTRSPLVDIAENPGQELHIFPPTNLSEFQWNWVERAAEKHRIFIYSLSPCQHFWSDFRRPTKGGGRQECFHEDETVEWFLGMHPLLVSWGEVYRRFARHMEERENIQETLYSVPFSISQREEYQSMFFEELLQEGKSHELRLLQGLQADLLLLRNPLLSGTLDLSAEDCSLCVHEASTRYQEVLTLCDFLLHRMEEDPSLSPEDILVLCPQLELYESCLRSVFQESTLPFDFQIAESSFVAEEEGELGVFYLLSLAHSSWQRDQVEHLLRTPIFSLSFEEKEHFINWAVEVKVSWGVDILHRQRYMAYQGLRYEDESSTWKEAVECSHDPVVQKVWERLEELYRDLEFCEGASYNISFWVEKLQKLIHKYIDLSTSPFRARLEEIFHSIEGWGEGVKSQRLRFSSFLSWFSQLRENTSQDYQGEFLHAIRIHPLRSLHALPAKIVCLIGMDETAFPQVQHSLSDTWESLHDKTSSPSPIDQERHALFEALLSARENVWISYATISAGDSIKQKPSLCVEELFHYLDQAFSLGGELPSKQCWHVHPPYPFHQTYFQGDNPKKQSSSIREYLAARKYYRYDPKNNLPRVRIQQKEETIDLNDFTKLIKDPVKYFLNHSLGVFCLEEESEAVFLSPLERAIGRYGFLRNEEQLLFSRLERERGLRSETCKKIVQEQWGEELLLMQNSMKRLGLHREQLFEIVLDSHCKKPYKDEKGAWIVPPIDFSSFHLVGKIPYVSSSGLLFLSKQDHAQKWVTWPQRLTYQYVIQKYDLGLEPFFCSLATAKKESFPLASSKEILEKMLSSLLPWKESLVPLLPDSVASLVQGNERGLENALKHSLRRREVAWAYQRHPDLFAVKFLIARWQGKLQEVFPQEERK